MNIPMLSGRTLQGLHKLIQNALDDDDRAIRDGRARQYFVRETADWRRTADEMEAELADRELKFGPIDWLSNRRPD